MNEEASKIRTLCEAEFEARLLESQKKAFQRKEDLEGLYVFGIELEDFLRVTEAKKYWYTR